MVDGEHMSIRGEIPYGIEERRERKRRLREEILPLYKRGGTIDQIAQITSTSGEDILSVIEDYDERSFSFGVKKKNELYGTETPFLDGQSSIKFAQELYKKGWFTENISCWQEVNEFCIKHRIEIPPNFYDQLRLEGFYCAIMFALMGDENRLSVYRQIGNNIDSEWFGKWKERESLIEEEVGKEVKQLKIGIERRFLGFDDGGNIVFDDMNQALSRLKKRWGIVVDSPAFDDVGREYGRAIDMERIRLELGGNFSGSRRRRGYRSSKG